MSEIFRSRREVLQIGSMGLVASLAGCSTLSSTKISEMRITNPQVTNWVEQPFDLDVHLLDDGETVYWQTVRVDARESGENGELGGATLDGFPDEPAEYVLYTRLVSVGEDDPVRGDLVSAARKADQSCLKLTIQIDVTGPRGEEYPSVSITYSQDC